MSINELAAYLSLVEQDEVNRLINEVLYNISEVGIDSPHNEPHLVLEELFRVSDAQLKDRLNIAILESLSSTTSRSSPSSVYTILQTVGATSPRGARNLLRQRVFEGAWLNQEYGELSLHELALTICARYGVDHDLKNYLVHFASSAATLGPKLLAYRLLSFGAPSEMVAVFGELLGYVHAEEEVEQVARVTSGILKRLGSRLFYLWILEFEEELFDRRQSNAAKAVLDRAFFLGQFNDPYSRLVRAHLDSHERLLSANEIREVASLEKVGGRSLITITLHRIWDRGKSLQSDSPWIVVDLDETIRHLSWGTQIPVKSGGGRVVFVPQTKTGGESFCDVPSEQEARLLAMVRANEELSLRTSEELELTY